MKDKTEALFKALGIFLALNGVMFAGVFVRRWLEIRPRPSPPGLIFVAEVFLLIVAYHYYRNTVRRD